MNEKVTAGRKRYNREIEPLIKEVAKHRGIVLEICRQFSKSAKRPIHRQTVDGWLHVDRERRLEPGYGNGRILIEAVKASLEVARTADGMKCAED